MNIGFIGAGNMAYALAKSIKNSFKDFSLFFIDIDKSRVELFKKDINSDGFCSTPNELAEKSDIIFICVKPQLLVDALLPYKDVKKVFVSIVAGVKLEKLQGLLNGAAVVRVMPNTPCFYSEMAASICASKNIKSNDLNIVVSLLESAGVVVRLDEQQFDAVTGLSGSGPAFVARLIEAFALAGESVGLEKSVSYKLALQTFKGTAIMLEKSNMSTEDLVKMVSSPGGTTVAGREILEKSNYKEILKETVIAAKNRSEELGR